jgi:hypothetical protein
MSNQEAAIKAIVEGCVESFAQGFSQRHIADYDDPEGTLNMKIHNIFIAVLGDDIRYFTALARSLDSSLGTMLETMAIKIAGLNYNVEQYVSGQIYESQTTAIAILLNEYKERRKKPDIQDYQFIASLHEGNFTKKSHDSDYYLFDRESNTHTLIELKIGGDLDNKKARSEKEALLEQYCILSNALGADSKLNLRFATAYNKNGEGNQWKQERVKQFFAHDELLIGKDFWNFITKRADGYEIVMAAYKNSSGILKNSLSEIKQRYLSI